MTCQRNKPMLNDANKNDHECVFYIICLEQNFYIDVLLRNMHTHNILIEICNILWIRRYNHHIQQNYLFPT